MITWDDFDKIWASTSPLTPYSFSDPNYAQGWNFIGSTPPARQMWDSIQKQNDEKFKYLRDNFGTPNIVTQASQMTDTDKVYVYLGSEVGWNSGHWYYYDEGTSSWADGGVYNSVAFVTDTTLSIAGQPADAKATGDALALKSDLAGCTFTGNVSVNADLSVTGDASIGTDLSVAGTSTLTGNVSANGDVTVTGDVSSANITTSANGTIGGNLSVSGTTALAGTSTAPTPSADDNSTKIATTEYVQTEIKPIETDVTINDKRISNIEKLLQGNLYDYDTDTDSKYVKTVPQGAMPYASLDSVGGKTVVWNQLANPVFATYTRNGVTVTNNNDGSITVNLTCSAQFSQGVVVSTPFVSGHVYALTDSKNEADYDLLTLGVGFYKNGTYTSFMHDFKFNTIRTLTHTNPDVNEIICNVEVHPGTYNNVTVIPQFYDLTLMFGAGNEPTTVQEFQQMFSADYYAYNSGSLLSAGVTEVVSKDADNTEIATYSIPAEVQALEGYGWSAGSVYNYIDYERKVFVKCVDRVDMGTLTWSYQDENERFYTSGLSGVIKTPSNSNKANLINQKYITNSYQSYTDKEVCATSSGNVFIKDSSYTDDSAFESALSGVYSYYELATPVETDISAYLTDDNLIEVEAGGTLTFPNSNGTDYQIPVPSAETYMVDLQASL